MRFHEFNSIWIGFPDLFKNNPCDAFPHLPPVLGECPIDWGRWASPFEPPTNMIDVLKMGEKKTRDEKTFLGILYDSDN